MSPTYHLWIKPSGEVYNLLLKTIADLSQSYQSPFFEPHVTLLDSLPGTEEEISVRLSQLGASLRPFAIQLTEPAYGDQYFQCVFLRVQDDPEIMRARKLANGLYVMESSPYMPHLSLLYGNYPSQLKKKIANTLPHVLQLHFIVDRIELICSQSDDPRDWHPIMTVPLGG